uniref:GH16 domain-containing protein n=1 Tax=Acrobeloides nanus TaxID=290746 RepID=A0A914ERB6_9BILA
MGVDSGGYATNPETEYKKIKTVIEAAIEHGIYVIVDFHHDKAYNYENTSIQFFKNISTTYGSYPHIIYEIINEPTVTWSTIKTYAEHVIDAIRANDPDNVIIVGTPNYSTDVDVAANDTISGSNIAYSLHYYAPTQGQWNRDEPTKAMNSGVALFVSQYGVTTSSQNGTINETAARECASAALKLGTTANQINDFNYWTNSTNGVAPTPVSSANDWTYGAGTLINNMLKSKDQGVSCSFSCTVYHNNLKIYENDLAQVLGPYSSCCQHCEQTAGCKAYSWNNGTCYLKKDTQPLVNSSYDYTGMLKPTTEENYVLKKSYNSTGFFDYFDFATQDWSLIGYTNFTTRAVAESLGLIKTQNGKIYIGVENTTVLPADSARGRPAVRVESKAKYNSGLFIFSIDRMPVGAGTWPAFWTFGPSWPTNGEIDVLEMISTHDYNSITLHTRDNCAMQAADQQFFKGTWNNNKKNVPGTNCYINDTVFEIIAFEILNLFTSSSL